MKPVSHKSPKLLDQLRLKLRANHYSYRTEQSYVRWVERFLRYHRDQNQGVWKHPAEMGKAEVDEYLTWLAVHENVAPSTQNQAFSALLYFWAHVLEQKLPGIQAGRAQTKQHVPVVLTQAEVVRLLPEVRPEPYGLMCKLMYGTGMRLMECCRLRVKDVDFGRRQIVIRQGKGGKDRVVPLRCRNRVVPLRCRKGTANFTKNGRPQSLQETVRRHPACAARRWAGEFNAFGVDKVGLSGVTAGWGSGWSSQHAFPAA